MRVEIICDRKGFLLKPHCDIKEKLLSGLIFVNKLNEVKADKIKPTAQVTGLENVMRKDKGRAKTKQETEKLLELAPEIKDGYVKVKAVL